MKNIPLLAAVLTIGIGLNGCSATISSDLFGLNRNTTTSKPVNPTNNTGVQVLPQTVKPYRLSSNHWSDVANIRNRASELSIRVGNGDITKVQAAQLLNEYRMSLVGSNPVDDNMYSVYLRAATQSQSGQITTEQSKRLIQNALSGWGQRWPSMQNKPTNPAFTNFLNEIMGVVPLK